MATKLIRVGWALLFTLAWGTNSMAQDFIKVVDTVSGRGLKAIQLAMPEFSKHGLSLDGYQVVVMEVGGKLIVLFKDAEAPVSQRGSTPKKRGFEVELDDAVVVRANFVR